MPGRTGARIRRLFAWAPALLAAACVSYPPPPAATRTAHLDADRIVTADGAELGLSVWRPAAPPPAVILAVHGMNDYAGAFTEAATWWSGEAGLAVYAYDQRGFGRSPSRGRWPGGDALRRDLNDAIAAVRAAHPDIPLYVLGHSMGAAVVLSAARAGPLAVDGAILAAPAVWGGSEISAFYRLTANVAASVTPGKTLTGARAARQASDNIAALRAMSADPLVIKETRLDAVLGVMRLMGEAFNGTDEVGGAALVLMGERDEIIPLKSMRKAALRLCGEVETRIYAKGWHLLLRDLQAETVWRGVAAWIASRNAADPGKGALGPAAFACDD